MSSEIDVLVIHGDRAVIVQAKSKRLTLAARRGNIDEIKKDFAAAVQSAYEQGRICAELMNLPQYSMKTKEGLDISNFRPKHIYIICLVSDHYPSLYTQGRELLKANDDKVSAYPFVMNVFFLDIICEFLDTPLYFLSYLAKRSRYARKIVSDDELVVLAFHLQSNLYISDQLDGIYLENEVGNPLNVAFYVRRDGLPGQATPEGILTKYRGTAIGSLIDILKLDKSGYAIDVGLSSLDLSYETAINFGNAIIKIANYKNSQNVGE